MKSGDDQYGKRLLAPLHATPPMDPQSAAREREKFLLQGQEMRRELLARSSGNVAQRRRRESRPGWLGRPFPVLKLAVAVILVFIVLAGSTATVYAAQSSLPGDPLYVIKSLSEDIRMSLTFSPKARLELTLDYTNRRIEEISLLVEEGNALSEKASQRFEGEMENALLLAAKMGDIQMLNALGQIKRTAEGHGMTIEELVNRMPDQADPAIRRLQARIEEQVRLSNMGELDPQAFRLEMRERQLERNEYRHRQSEREENNIDKPNTTAIPSQDSKKPGNNGSKSTDEPGSNNPNTGQGKPTQAGGK